MNNNIIYKFSDFRKRLVFLAAIILFMLFPSACKKFVETDIPRTELISENVYADESTALAAVSGVYYKLWDLGYLLAQPTGLASDELTNQSTDPEQTQVFTNAMLPTNFFSLSCWTRFYETIYSCNAAMDGLSNSPLRQSFKNQLMGEVKFIRAFSLFYLVNLYGNVPLITGTDYRINAVLPRTSSDSIYLFIVNELVEAKGLLTDNYPTVEKVRVNKSAAIALLARVYLYNKKYQEAGAEAELVISGNNYTIEEDRNNISLPNNSEAILQFYPSQLRYGTGCNEAVNFVPIYGPASVGLSTLMLDQFENNDERKSAWIGSIEFSGITYIFPNKYKVPYTTIAVEYSSALRLPEQYFIRAEVRAESNQLLEAVDDINYVRQFAGVNNVSVPATKEEVLLLIEQERSREYFTEWGHRWLDLKRTNRASAILGAIKQNWDENDVLWPIPQKERLNNPALSQNPGYN